MEKDKNEKKIEGISTFNTFKVFENIYRDDSGQKDYWELEVPEERKKLGFGIKLLVFVFVLSVLGFGVYPALSYLLKTPYPLLVVSEDNLGPVIQKNDLVLVRGVVDKQEIKSNDLIVFTNIGDDERNLVVQKVVEVDKDRGQLTVCGETIDSLGVSIAMNQVVGKLVGNKNPFKVPFIGTAIEYFVR